MNTKKDRKREMLPLESDLLAKSDREPVDYLSQRHKADPKTKSTEAAKARDEV